MGVLRAEDETRRDGAEPRPGVARLADRRPGPPHLKLVGSLDGLPDEELMGRYRDGDVAAFDVLVRRYRGPVLSFLRRLVHRPARAEELLGDVFLKLHRAAPRYQPTAKFKTYLYTVAYRAALNARDRARHQLDRSVGGDAELEARHGQNLGSRRLGDDPERAVEVKQTMAVLERELSALPEAHQAAFVLYYQQGLSCAELAECLGITPAEAKGRLAYARKLLRGRLAPLLAERGTS
jgi:RNA polymerase sigma-70 factor, ECF subfamily